MLDHFKKLWDAAPWYLKLALPLIIFALFFEKGRALVFSFLEKRAQSKTDQQVEQLEQSQQKEAVEAAIHEDRIKTLENQKDDAAKQAAQDDAIDFANSRKKRDQ